MDWTHILAFNLTLLAAIAAPGPSLLYLSRTAIVQGRRAGIVAALGLGLMAALWTGAALLGLQILFDLFPWAFWGLKIAGGTYLLWIAYATWRSAGDAVGEAPPLSDGRAFANGLLINLGNPKSILFAGAVIVAVFPANLTGADKVFIFFNHLVVEWTVQPMMAVLLSTAAVRSRYLGAKSVLDRIAGTVMGLLGLRLLLDRSTPTP